MNHKVVIAEPLATSGIEALSAVATVDIRINADRADLLAALSDATALVVRSATRVDVELLEASPLLKVVGRAGVGVDNIDVAAATARGVLVVNAPHANTISAAEHTMALILGQARNIARAHASLIAGNWDRKSFNGIELHGKTLGVVGLGKIGTLVAQRCIAFGMSVVAYDPFVSEDRARRLGVELTALEGVFARADIITIHLPKNQETEGLFGKENLAKCKIGVRIVNASRGGIVDEEALAEAIRSGHVAGAALDVFAVEPTTESPLFELAQVVVTPHLGASTAEAQDKAGSDVAEAVAAALRGELVLSAVNVDLGIEVTDEVRAFLPVAENLGRAIVGLEDGLSGRLVIRAEGRIADHELKPLRLAVLKGALSAVSTEPVTYVNATSIASERGIVVEMESSEASIEYVSLLRVSDPGRDISLAGTLARKGPMMVEILGHEVELPFSDHLVIVRNLDVPGVIGRVGSFVGSIGVNIANMVVGRSMVTGEAAMMGLNIDQALTPDQVDGLRQLDGVVEARAINLG